MCSLTSFLCRNRFLLCILNICKDAMGCLPKVVGVDVVEMALWAKVYMLIFYLLMIILCEFLHLWTLQSVNFNSFHFLIRKTHPRFGLKGTYKMARLQRLWLKASWKWPSKRNLSPKPRRRIWRFFWARMSVYFCCYVVELCKCAFYCYLVKLRCMHDIW